MSYVIAWCGFVGAWLLFAGPVYQASLELLDESINREAVAAAIQNAPRAQRSSPWWWLVPPVAYLRERGFRRTQRQLVLQELERDQLESVVDFTDKSAGWLLVGLGGLLIAVSETWGLRERYGWPLGVFWGLVVGMGVLSVSYVAGRQHRSRDLLAKDEAAAKAHPA